MGQGRGRAVDQRLLTDDDALALQVHLHIQVHVHAHLHAHFHVQIHVEIPGRRCIIIDGHGQGSVDGLQLGRLLFGGGIVKGRGARRVLLVRPADGQIRIEAVHSDDMLVVSLLLVVRVLLLMVRRLLLLVVVVR